MTACRHGRGCEGFCLVEPDEQDVDDALEAIFARADQLAPDDAAVGDWLASVRCDREASIDILIAYLSATTWCRHPKRDAFVERVRERLDELSPGDADRLLEGLT